MLRHVNNTLSNGQEFTATAVSENVIDAGSAGLGNGNPVLVEATARAAFTGLTSLKVMLQDSADNSTFAEVYTSKAFLPADLGATGKPFWKCALPEGVRRYIRLNYVVVGTGTAGSVDAAIVNGQV